MARRVCEFYVARRECEFYVARRECEFYVACRGCEFYVAYLEPFARVAVVRGELGLREAHLCRIRRINMQNSPNCYAQFAERRTS